MTITLNQTLEAIQELPPQQQDMLFEILRQRRTQAWRDSIVEDAQQAWEDYQAGRLKAQTAEEVIATLHRTLDANDGGSQ